MDKIPDNILNPDLYRQAKRKADATFEKHGAYKSMYIQTQYKKLGGKYKGQLQTWFLLRLEEKNSSINLDHDPSPEFDKFDWVSYWFPLSKIVDFKKEAYREALNELRKFL